MSEIIFLTGGNAADERTRQIIYDEAQKMLSDTQSEKETEKSSIVRNGRNGSKYDTNRNPG